jgi:hypothetical protein
LKEVEHMADGMSRRVDRSTRPGQWIVLCALLAALLCSISCARSLRNPFSMAGPPAPDVLVAASSLDQIIAAVNGNAQKVRTYQTNNATITIPGSLGIPTLRGNIAAQRPGRVRLQASTAVTGPEVDLGSNEELFWFWVKRNQPSQVYFARHAQTPGSAAQQLMPIDPQWLLDALGLAEFKPTDRHEGPLPIDEDRVEIKSIVQTASGPMTKRTVVDARKAWVLEQHMYDAGGALVASAVAKSHRYYPETGASLPQEVEIRVPPAELAMTIDVGTVELNRLTENPQLWAMPTIAGSPAMDLGAQPPTNAGGGVPTMGSQINGANWYEPTPLATAPASLGMIPAARVTSGAELMGTGAASVAAAAGGGGPAPQFVPSGGVTAQPIVPMGVTQPAAASSAQRLPSGGVGVSGAAMLAR